MKRKLITAATAAVLVMFAADAAAKPVTIDYVGKGCTHNVSSVATHTYAQTFRPTFDFLSKAQFVLFRTDLSTDKVVFVVHLRDMNGQLMATSNPGVLRAYTTWDAAASGDAVSFVFKGRTSVTPGQSYRLELQLVSAGDDTVAAVCIVPDPIDEETPGYADGYMMWDTNAMPGYDLEFSVTGREAPQ